MRQSLKNQIVGQLMVCEGTKNRQLSDALERTRKALTAQRHELDRLIADIDGIIGNGEASGNKESQTTESQAVARFRKEAGMMLQVKPTQKKD